MTASIKDSLDQFIKVINECKKTVFIAESFKEKFTKEQLEELKKLAIIKFIPDDYLVPGCTAFIMSPESLNFKMKEDYYDIPR